MKMRGLKPGPERCRETLIFIQRVLLLLLFSNTYGEMYSIYQFSISRLNNAEFLSLFLSLNKAIDNVGAENLGLDETMMSEFGSVLGRLTEQVRSSSASQFTQAMDQANSKRVQIYKRIIYKLKAVEVAEENSDLLACKPQVETYILGSYGLSVTKLPLQEITPVINGFCYDLRDKLSEDDLDVLGATSDLSRLEQANQAFIEAYNNRAEERAQVGNGLTVALRQQMNDIFLNICYTTQYLANSQATSNAAKAKACQPFIEVVNQYLTEAKSRYNQRMAALKRKNEGEDPEGTGDNGQSGNDGNQQTGGNNTNTDGNQQTGGKNTNTGDTNTGGGTGSGGVNVPIEY